VTVRCQTAQGGADVAAHVVLAMAARAGIPPLAADRLRGDVREAMCLVEAPAELTCRSEDDGISIVISAPDGRLEAVTTALSGHFAVVEGGAVQVRIRRTPLRSV
jgi:hypothetical protein